MSEKYNTIVILHISSYSAKKQLGEQLFDFSKIINRIFSKNALHDPDSSDTHLIFTFSHPVPAICTIIEALRKLKKLKWLSALKKIPLQTIICLEKQGVSDSLPRNPKDTTWEFIEPEDIYINRTMKVHWHQFLEKLKFPEHEIIDELGGIHKILFSKPFDYKQNQLFPCRDIVTSGDMPECYYCGMNTHNPANCPSKLLSMNDNAVQFVGYIPLAQLQKAYEEVFTTPKPTMEALAGGLKIAQIRDNPNYTAFVSYFDIHKVFQLRFLVKLSFDSNKKWPGMKDNSKIEIDQQNLLLGYDCLRVGQQEEALNLLTQEAERIGGKTFWANIGLAYLSLEQERSNEMWHYLEKAKSVARSDKENVYISILLSRYFELNNDYLKADEEVSKVFGIAPECLIARYRRVIINTRESFTKSQLEELKYLVQFHREYFIYSLLDPALLDFQGLIEDILDIRIQVVSQYALESFSRANVEVNDMKNWFNKDSNELKTSMETLQKIEAQKEKESFFDLLDVFEKSDQLILACDRQKKTKQKELEEKQKAAMENYSTHSLFWSRYNYKSFYVSFSQKLEVLNLKLSDCKILVERSTGQTCRQADKMFKEIEKTIAELETLVPKMNGLKLFFDSAITFCKKLAITETALTALLIALSIMGSFMNNFDGTTGESLADKLFDTKNIFILTLIIAPIIASIMTITSFEQKKSQDKNITPKKTAAKTKPKKIKNKVKKNNAVKGKKSKT
jgi:hypothetical protein